MHYNLQLLTTLEMNVAVFTEAGRNVAGFITVFRREIVILFKKWNEKEIRSTAESEKDNYSTARPMMLLVNFRTCILKENINIQHIRYLLASHHPPR